MLSQELRPNTWSEMAGQQENIKILKAIIKDPEHAPKCLIFSGAFGSGKSTSARILVRELNKLSDDYIGETLLNSKFYEEYDSTIIGNIDIIRRLRDDWTINYGEYYRVIVLDECLRGDSEILLEDGSSLPIKKIVEDEMKVNVLSYNEKTGKVEPKRVTGWFKNNPKVFYKVKTARSKKSIWVSDNHRFITSDGEKTIRDLHIGDNLLMYRYNLSEDEKSVLLGTLMGDSWIDKAPRNSLCSSPRFCLVQGVDQLDWLKVKTEALSNLMSETGITKNPENNSPKAYEGSEDIYSANSKSIPCLREISDMFFEYPLREKRVKRETLNQLGAVGLATWYMDDGSVHINKYQKKDGSITITPRVELHTECFTSEDNDIIIDYFKEEWDIEVNKYFYNNYYYLYMNMENSKKFLEIVAPYFVDGVLEYKLGGLYKPGNKLKDIQKGEYGVHDDPVVEISLANPWPESAYDLEVEDNHNYFGGNMLVHNCHAVSTAAQNALLKVFEETQGRIFFVMCADGDGLVNTQDGIKKLKDVESGDIVATEIGPRKVKDKYYNGKKEVFEVETSQGNSMNLTENHRIRIFDGSSWVWKKVRDVKVGDIIPCFKNFHVGGIEDSNNKCNLSLKQCEFLGRMFGDGWWTTQAHTGIIFNTQEVEYGKSLIEEAGIVITDSENCYSDSSASFYIHKLDKFGDIVKDKYGLLDYTARGENKSHKHLPSEVYKMSKEQFDSFLFGWIGADGYFMDNRNHELKRVPKYKQPEDKRNHFVIYCSSKEAVYEAKCIAESFGYKMSISKSVRHDDGTNKSVGVKEGDYTIYRLYTRRGTVTIPFSESKRKELMSEYSLLRYVQGCNWSIKMMKELHIDEFSRDVSYDKITSVKSVGMRDVYDLEVPEADSFIYNGMSIHNCTTEPNKILPTIRSRSLELQFNPVPFEDIIKNIEKVVQDRNISISNESIRLIADRADGHMRNAHMLLDKYLLLGEQDFRDSIKSSVQLYCDYLKAIYNREDDKVIEILNDLMNVPKDNLHSDWNTVMTESLKSFCGFDIKHDEVKELVGLYKTDFQYVSSCYMSTWIKNAFVDMPNFQATMLNLYLVLSNTLKKKETQTQQAQSTVRSNSRYGTPVR